MIRKACPHCGAARHFTGWRTGLLAFVDSWAGVVFCRFEDNEIDIDNRCDQPINISEATFEAG